MNLVHHLLRNARVRPDAPALARGDVVVATWAQTQARVARLAGGLLIRLAAGERVALVMANTPVYAELLYACWHAGLAAVPVNAKLHPKEIAYILDNSGAGLILATPDLVEAVAAARVDAASRAPVINVAGAVLSGAFHSGLKFGLWRRRTYQSFKGGSVTVISFFNPSRRMIKVMLFPHPFSARAG